jgi:hypothetical protein
VAQWARPSWPDGPKSAGPPWIRPRGPSGQLGPCWTPMGRCAAYGPYRPVRSEHPGGRRPPTLGVRRAPAAARLPGGDGASGSSTTRWGELDLVATMRASPYSNQADTARRPVRRDGGTTSRARRLQARWRGEPKDLAPVQSVGVRSSPTTRTRTYKKGR